MKHKAPGESISDHRIGPVQIRTYGFSLALQPHASGAEPAGWLENTAHLTGGRE